LKFDCTLAEFF